MKTPTTLTASTKYISYDRIKNFIQKEREEKEIKRNLEMINTMKSLITEDRKKETSNTPITVMIKEKPFGYINSEISPLMTHYVV